MTRYNGLLASVCFLALTVTCTNPPARQSGIRERASVVDPLFQESVDRIVLAACPERNFGVNSKVATLAKSSLNSSKLDAQLSIRDAALRIVGVPLAGENNEVHDCQRLNGMGPWVTIAALDQESSDGFKHKTPVVFISADAAYGEAGIPKGRSCGFLQDSAGWRAWIQPLPEGEKCTDQHFDMTAAPLSVRRETQDETHYVAARLLDGGGDHYSVGVQCGPKNWCVIYNNNSPGNKGKYIGPNDASGDAQYLAVRNLESPNKATQYQLVKSRLEGYIRVAEPVRPINPLKISDYNDWIRLATVRFNGGDDRALDAYREKLKWMENGPAFPKNKDIELLVRHTGTDPNSGWQIKFRYGDYYTDPQPAIYMSVTAGFRSARWQWRDSDEGVWVQCFTGCCGTGG